MATITRYVNTASTPGGDGTTNATEGDNRAYASLTEWEADENADLTDGAGDIMDCICEGAANDTSCIIMGWTTSAACYIQIRTTQATRHAGKWTEGSYQLEGGATPTLYILEEFTRIHGIQINTTGTAHYCLRVVCAGQTDIRVGHCIFKQVANAADYIMYLSAGFGASSEFKAYNNLFYDGYCSAYINDADCTFRFYNNTIVDMSNCGIRYNAGTEYLKNNIIDCADAFVGTFTDDDAQNDYNKVSQNEDNNALGSHGAYNQTFAYEDADNDDFHLDSGDTICKDLGVDLTSEGGFTDDIDADTRSGSWDIGMDELVAAAGGNIVPIFSEEGIHSNIFGGLVVR